MPSPVTTAPAGTVQTTFAHGVATLRFAHPKGNSLPATLLARLAEEIRGLGQRDDVSVIVLRSGDSGPFCAGASFDELKAIRDARAGKEFFMGFARVILAMTRCPKLIISRVHGKTVGGGVGLVAASDSAMAVDTDWRTARWAEEFGLYSRVFDSVNALDSALDLFARKLARTNPEAM